MTAKIRADVQYGNDDDGADDDEWRQSAHPWTVTLHYRGRQLTTNYWTGAALTAEPTARDVLESLTLDAAAGDQSFEDFCADMGYDTDSRKAHETWKECKKMTTKLLRFLGGDLYAEMVNTSPDEWDRERFADADA